MRHRDRARVTGFALLAAACLAGCNDGSQDSATQGTAAQGSSSADQTEIAKSNAYIIAANESSGLFAKALATYQDTISPKLRGDRPLENYAVVPAQDVTKIRARLETAGAMAGSIPELDPAARDYASAIAAFEPVNNGLANYAQSKGFLTDGGAKARAEHAAFVASLSKVVDAETVFFERIDARDARLTQEAYDNAPEGSVARYRAGIVLNGKAAMGDVATVFTDPADVAARQAFATNLDEMAGMVENWDRAVRAEKPEGCPAVQSSANLVIANGRKAIQSAEEGRFDPDSGTPCGGSDAPGWIVLRDDHGAVRGVSSLAMLQLYGTMGGETGWTTRRVSRSMVFDLPLDPAQGRVDRWWDERIWRLRALTGLTPTDEDLR